MASVLKLNDLSYHYGDEASGPVFRHLDLTVEAGEFVALVGGSGVGKSTLLRCVAGLIQPASGAVQIMTRPVAGERPLGFVFQDARLLPWRRLRENVAYGLRGLGLARAERDARLREVMELTAISELADRWPHQLSGGQQQRAGIARALAVHPQLLLMDEPFGAVDAITRQRLQDELLTIWRRTGKAVLFVTHDIEEAIYLADRVLVLASRPARFVLDQAVVLDRPRVRNDPALQQLAHDIAQAL